MNLIALPFFIKHFTSVTGYRTFQRQCPIYLTESYGIQSGNNVNLRDNFKLHTTSTMLLDKSIATTFHHPDTYRFVSIHATFQEIIQIIFLITNAIMLQKQTMCVFELIQLVCSSTHNVIRAAWTG